MHQLAVAVAGLRALNGPFLLTPFAAVKATPTRWDLVELCSVELVRQLAGESQLLCAVPPLAGAIAYTQGIKLGPCAPCAALAYAIPWASIPDGRYGMLRAELGRDGKGPHHYTSPYQVLASNLGDVQTVSKPQLWFEDSTLSPPRLPMPAELAPVTGWWRGRKTSNQRSSTTATLGAGSAAVMPCGQKRSGKRPLRLMDESS